MQATESATDFLPGVLAPPCEFPPPCSAYINVTSMPVLYGLGTCPSVLPTDEIVPVRGSSNIMGTGASFVGT